MPENEPAGGSSQSDIADGADESDGRWQTLVKTGLQESRPQGVSEKVNGVTPDYGFGGLTLVSSTVGDYAGLFAGGLQADGTEQPTAHNSAVLIKARYASNNAIGNLSDHHLIGCVDRFIDPTRDNIAVFQPDVGDETSGNVVVDSGGTDNDGSVTFPSDLTEYNTYTVLLDFAGVYLTADHTGFYVNGDPRKGNSPDADIAAVPNTDDTFFGIGYQSEGGQRMRVDYLEVATRQ